MSHTRNTSRGFTLIEVMISMAIFTILVTIGIGAVLGAIQQHHASENIRTAMDNLNFIMDDMGRNMRLGANVRCVTNSSETIAAAYSAPGTNTPVDPQNCPGRAGQIVFNDLNGNHLRYVITLASGVIQKSTSDAALQAITPPEVVINPLLSGFTVRGALPSSAGDLSQPTVTIRLAGTVTFKNVPSKFAIETTVALRALDS